MMTAENKPGEYHWNALFRNRRSRRSFIITVLNFSADNFSVCKTRQQRRFDHITYWYRPIHLQNWGQLFCPLINIYLTVFKLFINVYVQERPLLTSDCENNYIELSIIWWLEYIINFSGKNLWNPALGGTELLSKTKFEAGKVGRWEAEWDMQPTTNN